MGAWHKALKNVREQDPMMEFHIDCTRKVCLVGDRVSDTYWEGGLALKKMDFIKGAKAQGWTWDKNGDWLCPECSKVGE